MGQGIWNRRRKRNIDHAICIQPFSNLSSSELVYEPFAGVGGQVGQGTEVGTKSLLGTRSRTCNAGRLTGHG